MIMGNKNESSKSTNNKSFYNDNKISIFENLDSQMDIFAPANLRRKSCDCLLCGGKNNKKI